MTSAFSWQNVISLCPASFCTPRPNLPVTPVFLDFLLFTFFYFPTFYFFCILDIVNDAATSLYCNAVEECIYIFSN